MQRLFSILIHALLAVLGAVARQLHVEDQKTLQLIRFLSGCFIAAFTGVIVYFVTESLHMDTNLAYAAAGISGWVGPQMLDGVAGLVRKAAGLDERKSDEN
jgi:small basic protein